jgi:high-affinity iron transporter
MKNYPLVLLLAALALPVQADMQGLLQMVDYMGVDYPAAVAHGEITHAGEYAEMQEFAGHIMAESEALPAGAARDKSVTLARELVEAVEAKVDAPRIAELTRNLRQILMAGFDVTLTPTHRPDLASAARLYAEQCAGCHGATGNGDGAAGAHLNPPPIAFTKMDRARQRSLFGLYNTITLGVPGTSMKSFDALSPSERWSLAFYIGGLGGTPVDAAAAMTAWQREPLTLKEAVTLSPAELGAMREQGEQLALWLRHEPDALFTQKADPIEFTLRTLTQSLDAYRKGDRETAQTLSVTAYLEGFELSEAPLRNVAPELMQQTEQAMMEFRQGLRKGIPLPEAESRHGKLRQLLEQSRDALAQRSMSPGVAFTSSLIILLREGLEAILVLAAMVAFIVRSGRTDALRYVHGGWIFALFAGVLTWAASLYLIDISGATRELTEGIATLMAALILFYVGFWMHRNSSAAQWNAFLKGQIATALSARTLWTLAFIAFLAVYREVFETILFYQALWLQVESAAQHAIWMGAGLAAVLLVAITFAIERFGVRLPLRQFFLGSAILMIVLAVIFAGKGVMALQEAGLVGMHPLPLPRLEWIGFYPNAQVLATQLLMLAGAIWIFLLDQRSRKSA